MKRHAAKPLAGFTALVAVTLGLCCAATAQGSAPGPFSQDQVNAGREGFAANCAECHNKDLSGGEAPALVGAAFAGRWEKKTTAELYKLIQTTMPMCQAGLLGNRAYADIVSFLLWANGAQPGKDDFDGSAPVNIADIVTGTVRPDLSKSK